VGPAAVLEGGPARIDPDRYHISAKAGDAVSKEMMNGPMARNLGGASQPKVIDPHRWHRPGSTVALHRIEVTQPVDSAAQAPPHLPLKAEQIPRTLLHRFPFRLHAACSERVPHEFIVNHKCSPASMRPFAYSILLCSPRALCRGIGSDDRDSHAVAERCEDAN
jgi:hypothetical protein